MRCNALQTLETPSSLSIFCFLVNRCVAYCLFCAFTPCFCWYVCLVVCVYSSNLDWKETATLTVLFYILFYSILSLQLSLRVSFVLLSQPFPLFLFCLFTSVLWGTIEWCPPFSLLLALWGIHSGLSFFVPPPQAQAHGQLHCQPLEADVLSLVPWPQLKNTNNITYTYAISLSRKTHKYSTVAPHFFLFSPYLSNFLDFS